LCFVIGAEADVGDGHDARVDRTHHALHRNVVAARQAEAHRHILGEHRTIGAGVDDKPERAATVDHHRNGHVLGRIVSSGNARGLVGRNAGRWRRDRLGQARLGQDSACRAIANETPARQPFGLSFCTHPLPSMPCWQRQLS
jgi:hypothetical protein